ncbi:unnamed protein product [Nyctereutes procyonoides]|uniref:(raccoon dog) hypothetical protein n=1 Tax=Nyctereutes procyonoides TaxID=34880 RepID=A0A811YIH6_NYCPR|nr:unnamed protein product [Nyctereutes procyonoides]
MDTGVLKKLLELAEAKEMDVMDPVENLQKFLLPEHVVGCGRYMLIQIKTQVEVLEEICSRMTKKCEKAKEKAQELIKMTEMLVELVQQTEKSKSS